jgi:hypothetical protein
LLVEQKASAGAAGCAIPGAAVVPKSASSARAGSAVNAKIPSAMSAAFPSAYLIMMSPRNIPETFVMVLAKKIETRNSPGASKKGSRVAGCDSL